MSMRRSLAFVLGTSLLGAAASGHDDGTPIPEQLILVTRPGVTLDDVRAAHPGLTLVDVRHYTPARIHLVQTPAGAEGSYELELASDAALIVSAEQNKTVASPEEGTTQSLFLRSQRAGYATQGAFADINGPAIGRATAPQGTLVAVLDTGVAPHPDLAPRIAPGGYNFILDVPESDESACPPGSRLVGHGTYVAGLIALTDPQARILPVTVLGCDGVGNAFAVACGIYHALDLGAGVINMSFATTFQSDAVEAAVADAQAAGVTCVASVSNAARDTGLTPSFPADYEGVIGVGAVQHEAGGGAWSKAPFSDWGRSLRVAAPGVDVRSMWFDGAGYGYADGSGTSYAAAWVSGVCSVLHAKYGVRPGEWTQDRLCLTANDVRVGAGFGMGCGHRNDGVAPVVDGGRAVCQADFNADEFVDFFDYSAFVVAFETGAPGADVNGDEFLDFFDYDAFIAAFEAGC